MNFSENIKYKTIRKSREIDINMSIWNAIDVIDNRKNSINISVGLKFDLNRVIIFIMYYFIRIINHNFTNTNSF